MNLSKAEQRDIELQMTELLDAMVHGPLLIEHLASWFLVVSLWHQLTLASGRTGTTAARQVDLAERLLYRYDDNRRFELRPYELSELVRGIAYMRKIAASISKTLYQTVLTREIPNCQRRLLEIASRKI